MALRLGRDGGAAVIFSIAIALLSAASCAQVIGLEPYGSMGGGTASGATGGGATGGGGSTNEGGASTSASTSASGGGGSCTRCVATPDDWKGPVTVETGTVCRTGKAPLLVEALPLDDTICDSCSCDASGSCVLTITSASAAAGAQCSGDPTPVQGEKGCTNFARTLPGTLIEFAPAASNIGACSLSSMCPALAPTELAICALEQDCSGGACLPDGEVACVYDGPSPACPSAFPVPKPQGFAGYDPFCSCRGAPIGAKCDTLRVTAFELADCAPGNSDTPVTNQCAADDDKASVDYEPDEGACATPLLKANMNMPVYVCCTE